MLDTRFEDRWLAEYDGVDSLAKTKLTQLVFHILR